MILMVNRNGTFRLGNSKIESHLLKKLPIYLRVNVENFFLLLQTFQGWCSVPYFEKEELDDMRERAEAIYSQTGHYRRRYGKFEEHVEIDKLDGMYECIEVPEFEDSEPATVVHDFEKVSSVYSYF